MDSLFKALGDPARREILDALRENDGQTLSDLDARFDMTRFGVMKHLGVLEEAGLITTVRRGRFKHHYLNAVPLQEAIDRWIDPLLAKPAARALIDLKSRLEGDQRMLDTAPAPDFVLTTYIRCSSEALWQALTRAEQMQAYHFASDRADGDAAPGQATTFLNADGSTMLVQRTLAADPGSRLETSFEPHFGDSHEASRVTYTIQPEGAACRLTCEHHGLPAAQDGVRDGWARWAASLKSWLETGQPIKLA